MQDHPEHLQGRTQTILPAEGRFRSLMRAAEAQAMQEQRQRAAQLDHSICSQLAQAESELLVDVETAMLDAVASASRGGAGKTGSSKISSAAGNQPTARELLRAPLDGLSSSTRQLLAGYFDDEAASIKRALSGLAADLDAVHEQEGKRARLALAHIKSQFETRLGTVRSAAQEEIRLLRNDLKRECDAKVAAAERARVEAEATAAAAVEAHPTIDAAAWRQEQAALRVKAELYSSQVAQAEEELRTSKQNLTEARNTAERRAASARRQLSDTTKALEQSQNDLRIAQLSEERNYSALTRTQEELRTAKQRIEELKISLRAAVHRAKGVGGGKSHKEAGAAEASSRDGSGRCAYSLDAYTRISAGHGSVAEAGSHAAVGAASAAAALRDHQEAAPSADAEADAGADASLVAQEEAGAAVAEVGAAVADVAASASAEHLAPPPAAPESSPVAMAAAPDVAEVEAAEAAAEAAEAAAAAAAPAAR